MRERIDPTNLGEVLACAGIARLAWMRDPEARTGFDGEVFIAPDEALEGLTPALSETATGLALCGLPIDWWQPWGMNPALKNWAGNQSPMSVHRASVEQAATAAPQDWRSFACQTGGHLYIDTATGWDTLSLGWSINEHNEHKVAVRPWLEILASLGLQALRVDGDRVGGFRYRLWPIAELGLAGAVLRDTGLTQTTGTFYSAQTAKNGKNTYLLPAKPVTQAHGVRHETQ